jgi:hypothetical protein
MQGDERSGSHVTFLQKACVGAFSGLDALFETARPEGRLTQPFDVTRCEGLRPLRFAEQGEGTCPVAVGDGSTSAVDELVRPKRRHASPSLRLPLTPRAYG